MSCSLSLLLLEISPKSRFPNKTNFSLEMWKILTLTSATFFKLVADGLGDALVVADPIDLFNTCLLVLSLLNLSLALPDNADRTAGLVGDVAFLSAEAADKEPFVNFGLAATVVLDRVLVGGLKLNN